MKTGRPAPPEDLPSYQRRVEQGELADVVRELGQREDLDPDSARTLLYWQRHLGDSEGAQRTASELLQRDPSDTFVIQTLADIAWIDGDYAGAGRHLAVLEGLARAGGDPRVLAGVEAQQESLRAHVSATVLEARRAEATLDALFWCAIGVTVLATLAAGFLGSWWGHLRKPTGGR